MWYADLVRLLADAPWALPDHQDLFVSMAYLPSFLMVAGCNSKAVEAQNLKDRGIPESVVSMMLKARKVTSSKVYHQRGIFHLV